MSLDQLGWNEFFIEAFEKMALGGCVPARVTKQARYGYLIQVEGKEIPAEPSGRVKAENLPAVGDWVAVNVNEDGDGGVIQGILPRRTVFSRKVPGEVTSEQIVAANVDFVFLVVGMDRDFNLRRIERYMTLIYNSGASPVVVLNKADMCADVQGRQAEAEAVAPGAPVHSVSAQSGAGVDELRGYLLKGRTIAFLGSSGAGKSTLINRLLGEERMATGEVRNGDGKGKHTTSHRELVLLPEGGALIDTPGMREIQVWGEADGLLGSFPEIGQMSYGCRFRDCRHEMEPGCAVLKAVDDGELPEERYGSYIKLREELENLKLRKSESARRDEKLQGRRFSRMVREVNRYNPKRS